MQVLPVIAVEAHNIGNAKPGQVTKKISDLYTEFFNQYCSGK